jgi:hypothetical protein
VADCRKRRRNNTEEESGGSNIYFRKLTNIIIKLYYAHKMTKLVQKMYEPPKVLRGNTILLPLYHTI